ncbi:hypothetical protein [Maridesulfovibrio sp.]
MSYSVIFSPEAEEQLVGLYRMDENVVILSIYYGGQNYEEKLNDDTQQ